MEVEHGVERGVRVGTRSTGLDVELRAWTWTTGLYVEYVAGREARG